MLYKNTRYLFKVHILDFADDNETLLLPTFYTFLSKTEHFFFNLNANKLVTLRFVPAHTLIFNGFFR